MNTVLGLGCSQQGQVHQQLVVHKLVRLRTLRLAVQQQHSKDIPALSTVKHGALSCICSAAVTVMHEATGSWGACIGYMSGLTESAACSKSQQCLLQAKILLHLAERAALDQLHGLELALGLVQHTVYLHHPFQVVLDFLLQLQRYTKSLSTTSASKTSCWHLCAASAMRTGKFAALRAIVMAARSQGT